MRSHAPRGTSDPGAGTITNELAGLTGDHSSGKQDIHAACVRAGLCCAHHRPPAPPMPSPPPVPPPPLFPYHALPMKNGIIRWTIYLLALFAFGPVAGALTAWVRAPDGGDQATPIVSTTPLLGVAAALAAVLVALIPAGAAARLVDARAAMIAAGLTLAWPAFRAGSVDGVIRSNGSAGVLRLLSLEGLILGAAGVAVAVVLAAMHAKARGERNEPLFGPGIPQVLVAGVLAGAAAAWLIAQTPLPGQAFAAAVAAGVAAGAAGHLVEIRAALPTFAAAIAVLAVLGPWTASVFAVGGAGNLLVAGRNGALFPLANLHGLDWISGGLVGIPMGVAWAGSMIDKRAAKQA